MLTFLNQYGTILLLIAVIVVLIALRNTVRAFNQSRRAPYYILREEAARAAGRWTIISLVCVALTIALAVLRSRAQAEAPNEPPATVTLTPTQPIATLGPAPTRTPSPTPTLTPTPTAFPTLTPTVTPAPSIPAVLLTPIPNAISPDPDATFEFLTLASKIDENLNPLDPGLQFAAGTSRVYLFFRAAGVNDGAPWGLFCYRDGAIVDSFVGLWDDGTKVQTSRAFCALDGRSGTYVLRAYLGTQLTLEVQFSLLGAAIPTPSP